jgi:nucleotide-binding universal stress UspA family protein
MMTPSGYNNIAVASTFSPRFHQVLAEAKRISSQFGSSLSLIYVGEREVDTEKRFAEILSELGLPPDSNIHYAKGDPATAILQTIREQKIDMIIAGALEKEVILHPFLGNVARRLVREASSSVMLFTEPRTEPKRLNRMVFVTDHSDSSRAALQKAIGLAAAEKSERLYVIRIITTFDEIRAARGASADENEPVKSTVDEEAALEQLVLSMGPTDVPIEVRCIRGNTGFAGSDFVGSISADLLAVPMPVIRPKGQLPPSISWITDVIPCNLWVIR